MQLRTIVVGVPIFIAFKNTQKKRGKTTEQPPKRDADEELRMNLNNFAPFANAHRAEIEKEITTRAKEDRIEISLQEFWKGISAWQKELDYPSESLLIAINKSLESNNELAAFKPIAEHFDTNLVVLSLNKFLFTKAFPTFIGNIYLLIVNVEIEEKSNISPDQLVEINDQIEKVLSERFSPLSINSSLICFAIGECCSFSYVESAPGEPKSPVDLIKWIYSDTANVDEFYIDKMFKNKVVPSKKMNLFYEFLSGSLINEADPKDEKGPLVAINRMRPMLEFGALRLLYSQLILDFESFEKQQDNKKKKGLIEQFEEFKIQFMNALFAIRVTTGLDTYNRLEEIYMLEKTAAEIWDQLMMFKTNSVTKIQQDNQKKLEINQTILNIVLGSSIIFQVIDYFLPSAAGVWVKAVLGAGVVFLFAITILNYFRYARKKD